MKASYRVSALLTVAAFLCVSSGSLNAVADEGTFGESTSPTLYQYDVEIEDLPGAETRIQKGQIKAGEECLFDDTGGGSPTPGGQKITISAELWFDPSSCLREMARATYLASDVPARTLAAFPEARSAILSADAIKPTAFAPTASYSGRAQSNIHDPVYISVNYSGSEVNWVASSSCVTSYNSTGFTGYFPLSGWVKTYENKSQKNRTCESAWQNTIAYFSNSVFCVGDPTTKAYHYATRFDGKPAGKYSWSVQTQKSGGCSGLLTVVNTVIHP